MAAATQANACEHQLGEMDASATQGDDVPGQFEVGNKALCLFTRVPGPVLQVVKEGGRVDVDVPNQIGKAGCAIRLERPGRRVVDDLLPERFEAEVVADRPDFTEGDFGVDGGERDQGGAHEAGLLKRNKDESML